MIETHELSISTAECRETLHKACSPLRCIDRVYWAVPVHLTAAVLVHHRSGKINLRASCGKLTFLSDTTNKVNKCIDRTVLVFQCGVSLCGGVTLI